LDNENLISESKFSEGVNASFKSKTKQNKNGKAEDRDNEE